MNFVIITANIFTVLLDDRKFAFQTSRIQVSDIAGIAILRDQFERDLFSTAANEQRNMWLLHAFRLVDSAAYLVIFAFKDCFFFRPHSFDDAYCITQMA